MNAKTAALVGVVLLLLALLTACGSESNSTLQPSSTPLPRFEQVATSTEAPVIATIAATRAAGGSGDAPQADPTALARGESTWLRLECFSCHGENGEGGAGSIGDIEAPALTGLTLTQDEFIDWLRTGGTLGNDHLFSTDRLSDSGGRNLYQYVLSLGN